MADHSLLETLFLDSVTLHSPLFLFFNACLFLRETEREQGDGQREREGDTESKAGSRLGAVSTEPDSGLKLTNREIMT